MQAGRDTRVSLGCLAPPNFWQPHMRDMPSLFLSLPEAAACSLPPLTYLGLIVQDAQPQKGTFPRSACLPSCLEESAAVGRLARRRTQAARTGVDPPGPENMLHLEAMVCSFHPSPFCRHTCMHTTATLLGVWGTGEQFVTLYSVVPRANGYYFAAPRQPYCKRM